MGHRTAGAEPAADPVHQRPVGDRRVPQGEGDAQGVVLGGAELVERRDIDPLDAAEAREEARGLTDPAELGTIPRQPVETQADG
ncbi:hypothetical protein GCM10010129_40200 [Streptomyces fumigatiscleroticus]|nr:hypothetical protein GCM10010129_40200 [Streptomyces fumigatiscleroticus]